MAAAIDSKGPDGDMAARPVGKENLDRTGMGRRSLALGRAFSAKRFFCVTQRPRHTDIHARTGRVFTAI